MELIKMKQYLKLIRFEQYIKNVFVFAPLFFSGAFLNSDLFFKSLITFACFCLISSSVYILNDYFDINEDKLHPTKCKRPLAAGTISTKNALILFIILLFSSLSISFISNIDVFYTLLFYFILNVFYTLKLKHIPLLDINIIAIGFVLRIISGGFSTSVEPSIWLLIETYLLALFLALAKRRTDFVLHSNGHEVRKNIEGYSLIFIDITLGVLTSIITICYIFYCISPEVKQHYHSDLVYLSIIFVLNGLIRYLKLSIVDQTTYSPTLIVLKDRFIQITLLGWIILLGFLLYLN
jgi:decaprenyl-phosphate phosphoribosyltransferase